MEVNVDQIMQTLVDVATTYGLKLVAGLLVLVVGWMVIKRVVKVVDKIMVVRAIDETLRPFLRTLTSTLLKVAVVISALSIMGIEMTSFVAILGAAGLAVGMALSGTLQNFAGGVVILILRPFKKGDFVEAQGYTGTVHEIQIFHTILKTPDNKTVILPNGPLSTGSLINYTDEDTRRVDFTFGISYGDDSENARAVLLRLINEDPRILKDPEPNVFVGALADSSVNMTVRVWARTEDYWAVYFDLTEKVYKVFPNSDLNFPFPQMDVHLTKNGN